ncbi:hypothetical protein B5F07_11965 [Lachnoclostridium sp. An169]|uniref:hypothetical protein n=1 Tax=Lachnoclostridium sp. An169 TaxID=1965569 RepID=UPI000B38B835|nr:hypothetical protein [Lachnoclostridium sp. An169]OUP83126.1 hypothetical protein B5F07_11965 [Lachnoclostridium sp. An169]
MVYYDSELRKLQEEILEKERLDAQLADLLIQQDELKKRTAELEHQKFEEQEDVDRLKGRSLAAFFYRISGQMEDRLTIEEEEAYAAAMKYDAAAAELESVEQDIDRCRSRLAELRWCETRYQRALDAKKEAVRNSGRPEASDILSLEAQKTALESQQKEIDEAIRAGVRARDISQQLVGELESAKNWGTWDVIGGGFLTDMAKYEKLDQAQNLAQDLQSALRNFRTELADVKEEMSGDIQLNIGDFLHFADFFFDDIFSDWMVLDKISSSKERAEKTYDQIQKVLGRLRNLKDTILENMKTLDRKIEAIVTGTEL